MSTAATSPMRGTRRAAGGSSEYSTVAITWAPAPAANSISVAPGARLTIRSGACGHLDRAPRVIGDRARRAGMRQTASRSRQTANNASGPI